MKNKEIVIISILLVVSIGNYRIILEENIKSVTFLSIFAIGALTGILITQIIKVLKNKS